MRMVKELLLLGGEYESGNVINNANKQKLSKTEENRNFLIKQTTLIYYLKPFLSFSLWARTQRIQKLLSLLPLRIRYLHSQIAKVYSNDFFMMC